jgi:hypothetical protein
LQKSFTVYIIKMRNIFVSVASMRQQDTNMNVTAGRGRRNANFTPIVASSLRLLEDERIGNAKTSTSGATLGSLPTMTGVSSLSSAFQMAPAMAAATAEDAAMIANKFVNSVFNPQSFSYSYNLLQDCAIMQQAPILSRTSSCSTMSMSSRTGSPCSPRAFATTEESISPTPRFRKRLFPEEEQETADDQAQSKRQQPVVSSGSSKSLGQLRQRADTVSIESDEDSSEYSADDTSLASQSPTKKVRKSLAPAPKTTANAGGNRRRQTKNGLGGERRLNIQFTNSGRHVRPPQTFGKYGLVIPDGVQGTHTMYAQPWRFEIKHSRTKTGETVLTWSVTNLSSGSVVAMTETSEQAFQRQTKGNTICNIIVRLALQRRALDLQNEIQQYERAGNSTKVANLQSLLDEIIPIQCTEGLLFFGLRHAAVQNRPQMD